MSLENENMMWAGHGKCGLRKNKGGWVNNESWKCGGYVDVYAHISSPWGNFRSHGRSNLNGTLTVAK
jgi:hypothetical protein